MSLALMKRRPGDPNCRTCNNASDGSRPSKPMGHGRDLHAIKRWISPGLRWKCSGGHQEDVARRRQIAEKSQKMVVVRAKLIEDSEPSSSENSFVEILGTKKSSLNFRALI